MATDTDPLQCYTPAERHVLEFVMHCSGKTLDDINPRWCLLQAWAIGELAKLGVISNRLAPLVEIAFSKGAG